MDLKSVLEHQANHLLEGVAKWYFLVLIAKKKHSFMIESRDLFLAVDCRLLQ